MHNIKFFAWANQHDTNFSTSGKRHEKRSKIEIVAPTLNLIQWETTVSRSNMTWLDHRYSSERTQGWKVVEEKPKEKRQGPESEREQIRPRGQRINDWQSGEKISFLISFGGAPPRPLYPLEFQTFKPSSTPYYPRGPPLFHSLPYLLFPSVCASLWVSGLFSPLRYVPGTHCDLQTIVFHHNRAKWGHKTKTNATNP